MALYDFNKLLAQSQTIIKGIKEKKFTSHKFILLLAKKHQCDYIEVLAAYKDGKQPFAAAHRGLSRSLRKVPGVKFVRETMSTDIFGDKQTCAEWVKV